MSANSGPPDPGYPTNFLGSFISKKPAAPGMDLPPSRNSPRSEASEPSTKPSVMSMLTVQTSSMLPSPRHLLWDDTPPLETSSSSRSPLDRTEIIELPSIRQAIPEIEIQTGRGDESEYHTKSTLYSPTAGPGSLVTSPEYTQLSLLNKRRRLSTEDDADVRSRDRIVPRTYRSPPRASRPSSAAISPVSSARRTSAYSSAESWSSSAHNSPFITAQRASGVRSPPPFDSSNSSRPEWRPTLPSLPSLTLGGPAQHAYGRTNWSEYTLDTTRAGAQTYPQHTLSFEPPPPSYRPASFSYGYQQPRGQSYSGPSSVAQERTPFSAGSHHPGYAGAGYPHGNDVNDSVDGKQRKRRGNLPKETTDKLRAWFVAHLQHPYPTEDEKQELMRQTGLQMNQISNWFINARRRQLPTMINNARAESDARSARVGDRGEVTSDYGDERNKTALPLGDSDGDGSGYDEHDQMGAAPRHAIQEPRKRESI